LLLTIEKLIYGGDGLARLPANPHSDEKHERGKAVFVPFVLAGEKVDATLTEQKPGFARAKAVDIIESSPHRVQPACPYFSACGGCHYQHASYEHQLEIKKEILRETLRRMAKLALPCEIEVHPSPPWNYRNRSRLQVRTRPQFAAGYFKLASRELLAVEECPISSPLINRGLTALWQSGRSAKVPGGVREVEFFANADDTQLLLEVGCASDARRASVRVWAEELRTAMPEIAGVVAFREANPGNRKPGAQEILIAVGDASVTYQTQRAAYRVSAGSFFQTNRHLTDELVKIVTAGRSGDLALDLYAGVGLFSTALACDFRHIVSVEPSHLSSTDLSYNRPANGETIQATAEQYLTRQENDRQEKVGQENARRENPERSTNAAPLPPAIRRSDLVVVDPPRSGLGDRVAQLLAKLGSEQITYVSCDPATLARDLLPLLAAGYRVENVHLVDLFPQTYHVETIVHMAKG
jgi:23S rRNA (uracil1939-C5)-methyltransferase